ncbi:hypothetical protein S40285_08059 [Stachybotrys chlorohalonatus IBT 40285]|uniref:DNA-directed RNA polymerase II subunit RPB9-like zinc ribbon domain-containing protein n=1 Tax=Stachybotrys chlorohalonatus (strain IBT 40285) TaxID=1283841 RepID=A0A084QEV3_STAC4|nr:hypothetical protein S40285_08059 [Stachybotrys chlorohalonata IBT 40285]
MATPRSTASDEGAPSAPKKYEQVTFRFCSECSNMLYPKEDEVDRKLQYTCRTCQYTEDAQSSCVFRNILNSSSGETAGVTQDVGSDPTVSALWPIICLCCGVPIYCGTCGVASPDLSPSAHHETDHGDDSSMGMCQFNLGCSFYDADPYAEYDEEGDLTHASSDADTHSDTSEGCCSNGAKKVEL